MKRPSFKSSVVILLAIMSAVASAQVVSKINGVMYADYYNNLQNHSESKEGENAFSIRRYYFTFENNLSENIKTRFRLESAHGKFGSQEKIVPFVKHAYLEWSNLIPSHKLYIGIAETNAFKNVEDSWGYRSIEKTSMDLNKISSSADMGIALKGDLSETVHHWLTFFNGAGYGSAEVDKYKKIGYSLWLTPAEGLILEGYADYEKQDPESPTLAEDYSGASGYYTVKAFAGYSALNYTVGAEWFQQTRQESGARDAVIVNDAIASVTKADIVRSGYSLWGSWITPAPKLKLFARYDNYDPNSNDDVYTGANGSVLTGSGLDDDYSLIIAGLDYIPSANVHFMPNIMLKSYSKSNVDSDLTARITMYFKFDTGKIIVE